MLWNKHWLKKPPETKVTDMLPMAALAQDKITTITTENELVRVIQLQGRDYSGVPEDIQAASFLTRKQLFELGGASIGIATHSLRHQAGAAIKTGHHNAEIVDAMAKKWGAHLNDEIFRTTHYLVLYTRQPKMLDAIFSAKANNARSVKVKHEILQKTTKNVLARLGEFNPWVLDSDSQLSFWATMVNGKPEKVATNGNPYYADSIVNSNLYWPKDRPSLQVYENGGEDRLSTWLAIKQYPQTSTSKLFEKVFHLPISLSLHQNFAPVIDADAIKETKDREKNIASFQSDGGTFFDQAHEIKTELTAKSSSACMHSWALQIFGEDEEELNSNVADIEAALAPQSVLTIRETINQEALFWSIFPTMEAYNCRRRIITSKNASHACTFANTNEGLGSCSWGDEPITIFKTETGADYSLTFHNSTKNLALGNTLLFGGSEAGKTTFFQFLDHMCRKYEGHKSLIFDSLKGMKIAAELNGAEYEEFKDGSILNPFQLEDTKANRAFLTSFLQLASGKSDEDSLDVITGVIEQNYKLDFADRRLADLELSFGMDKAGSFAQAMHKWMPNGAYGHIFNANEDKLKFENNRVYFDCTLFQSLPEAFNLFAYYVFYAFRQHVQENPCPHTIFIDEMKRFLLNETFAKEILSAYEQERKTDGVIVAAIQEVGALLETDVGEHIIKSTATMFFFSDITGKHEEYVDGLGLTEEEFEWVKTPHPRQVLLKRPKSGESTILNVDLSPLGDKLLGTMNSSSKEVARLEKMQEELGDTYKQAFLDSL